MSWRSRKFEEIVDFHDNERVPLSGMERELRQGTYRYYGAQGVIDYIDAFIFDGEYVLIAEDGQIWLLGPNPSPRWRTVNSGSTITPMWCVRSQAYRRTTLCVH